MNRKEAEQHLYMAMSVGEQLLTCGAEVSRVEDTIKRICMAYGAKRVDVFSITSSIITSISGPEFGCITQTRRVTSVSNDMYKLDAYNNLSRKICSSLPSCDEIQKELDKIKNGPRYNFIQQIFIYALVSGCFSVFFGGDTMDMLASAVIGVILKFWETFIQKGRINGLMVAFICSIAGGFLANISVLLCFGHHVDLINIGNVMLFIPGVAFTNSLRDMFSGDIVTGLIRFVESLLMAIVLATGFALANFFF